MLEYCSPIWHGLNKKCKTKIEKVQRAATRYILGYPNLSYTERLLKLNMSPLTFRRDIADVCMLFKCIHGLYNVDITRFVSFVSNNTNVHMRSTADHNLMKIPLCKTNTCKNLYFNRIVKSWNKLPQDSRYSCSFPIFKKRTRHFMSTLVCNFNTECCCSLQYSYSCLFK